MNAALPTYHALKVARIVAETADATSVELDVPPALAPLFDYRPGQFLTLRVAHPDGELARCYSLSSSPGIDAKPRVTIKRVAGGRASNWLCDQLQAGAQVDVMAPAGVFVPARLDGDFTLLAGGSGITPMLSIIKAVLAKGSGRIWLLYANRDADAIIFRSELQALAQQYPQRLVVQHWLDQVQGIPSLEQMQALLARHGADQYFICGPKPFMDGAQAALKALGVERGKVRVERFVSLDAPGAMPETIELSGDVPGAALCVSLDGEEHRLTVPPNATLLDAMAAAGLNPPHSCRSGSCGACMCKVEEGSVTLKLNAVLDDDDLADGWTLACQGVPASAALRIRFPD
ncbi:ferredoxin--NADP reductase [Pseudoduganella ginsengisoli]|uniref:2Fe-2S iron-sulfur cluster binding domain-containing protein n=1 Tax=Pseudoduganella ginsengisoli TaxID=1462440 RepID=A0A6L6PWM7_9BURK|nr:ferredoxin--NADP reductase [Pseudoduganella ginsengisoli]MTW01646.1 2Fe-2S iron-sulfur cluster binding domain-containing protein [Pseudoduganella ginsengisoli]